MDALCEFIEHWLGPRRPSYGESEEALASRSLPMPLKRLYQFAGRWPSVRDDQEPMQFVVPAFSHQDYLLTLPKLKVEGDKIVFLNENQGVWDCRTLPEGEDPPVWRRGDQIDADRNLFTG